MSRLPKPGKDSTDWGEILNDFLLQSHNEDGSLKNTGLMATRAVDTSVVHTTGNETISGIKTFNDSPIVPNPQSLTAAANKQYVDSKTAAGISKGSVTISIAAFDAPEAIRARADFVCSGNNDDLVFAQAIAALNNPTATSVYGGVFGGGIHLSAGSFVFSHSLKFPTECIGVKIEGDSMYTTLIKWRGPNTEPMFHMVDKSLPGPGAQDYLQVEINNLWVAGDEVNGTGTTGAPSTMFAVGASTYLRMKNTYVECTANLPPDYKLTGVAVGITLGSYAKVFLDEVYLYTGEGGRAIVAADYSQITQYRCTTHGWKCIEAATGVTMLLRDSYYTTRYYQGPADSPASTNIAIDIANASGSVIIDSCTIRTGGYTTAAPGSVGVNLQLITGLRMVKIRNTNFYASYANSIFIKGPPTSVNIDLSLLVDGCRFDAVVWPNANTPAILLPGGRDHIIRDNLFAMPGDSIVLDNVLSAKIDDNEFTNCGAFADNVYAGIVLKNGTSKCRITQNTGKRNPGYTGAKLQTGLRIVDASCSANRVWGNDFVTDDEAITNVTDNGTGTLTTV